MSDKKSKAPHYLGHRKRIRERFLRAGLETFHDYEVIELLLTFSIQRKDVKPLAKGLISTFKSLQGVLDAPLEELKKVRGIGEQSALLLKLTGACSDFYLREQCLRKNVISSPDALLKYCKSSMAGLGEEQFRVIYLNAKNEVMHDEVIQEGTVDQSAVYPRKIMEHALRQKAVSLIFVHNHPSGNPEPSSHDKTLTADLVKAAKILSIIVHDHIIIGKKGYYSFRENNMM